MLQGTVDRGTGKVELQFEARFNFTASVLGRTLYSAPPLLVTTALTTASAQVPSRTDSYSMSELGAVHHIRCMQAVTSIKNIEDASSFRKMQALTSSMSKPAL